MNPRRSFYIREISVTYRSRRVPISPKLDDVFDQPHKVYELFRELGEEMREKMISVAVNARLKPLCYEIVSTGTINEAIVRPMEVFRSSLHLNPYGWIAVHNHPSGNPAPSRPDIEMTHRLRHVADLLGAQLLDHIIVSSGGYYSFQEAGWPLPKSDSATKPKARKR